MQDTQAFAPFYRVSRPAQSQVGTLYPSITVACSAGGATASGIFPGNPSPGQTQIQIANKTSAWAHVNFGILAETVTAATVAASYPVAPGAVVVVTVDQEVNASSVILDAAPASSDSVIFTRGGGL